MDKILNWKHIIYFRFTPNSKCVVFQIASVRNIISFIQCCSAFMIEFTLAHEKTRKIIVQILKTFCSLFKQDYIFTIVALHQGKFQVSLQKTYNNYYMTLHLNTDHFVFCSYLAYHQILCQSS